MPDATGQPKVERKLAAILAADVVGYSRLMGIDEEGTLARLKAHRRELIDPKIAEYHGRMVKLTGDGALVEFPSVVGAVRCAVDIQRGMISRNADEPEDKRIVFRVGVNLGDIIVDGDDIYGDGVNVATRLEALCEPGDICVSQVVRDQVRDKVDIAFEDGGDQQLKNISRPVRIYKLRLRPPSFENFRAALPLPDKPSIAVLPFANMSGDPSQEYFSDGITEDIITELSRFSELFVIARNSSFQYKGKSIDIRQVGRELGVRYVLEGSIRRAADRVRITAQLIDATTGAHRWAEHYDRELKDVFAVQDEVARAIVGIIACHVKKAETERTLLKPPATLQAYDYYMQGTDAVAALLSTFTVEKLYEARRLLEQSLSIDANYARAHAELSRTYVIAWLHPLDSDFLNSAAVDRAYWLASKAVQLDPNLPQAHASLGTVLRMKHQYDAAIATFERATALNPNHINFQYAVPLILSGNFSRAIEVLDACIRIDPFYPPFTIVFLGLTYFMLKRCAEALPLLRECTARAPNMRLAHICLAATYAQLDQTEEAQAEVVEVLKIEPAFTIDGTQRRLFRFKFPKDAEHFFDGLRKAGLPER
jgi:adenylate cyclase